MSLKRRNVQNEHVSSLWEADSYTIKGDSNKNIHKNPKKKYSGDPKLYGHMQPKGNMLNKYCNAHSQC